MLAQHPSTLSSLTLLASLSLSACASTSIHTDLANVQQRAHAPFLADVSSEEVTARGAPETRAILEKPLDADAAVRIALLNNRGLRAKLRELGVGRGRWVQAGLVANPVFEAEVLPEREASVELRVEYNLSSLVLAPLRAHAAKADLQAQRYRVAGAVVQLGYEVRVAVYALQAAELSERAASTAVETLAASRDTASALHAAGNIPALELLRHTTAHERARITLTQLELQTRERREHLQRVLGLADADADWQLQGTLPDLPDESPSQQHIERRAIEASHELASTDSASQAAARRVDLARVEGWLPEIDVGLSSLHGGEESAAGQEPPEQGPRIGGGVSLHVPLFDRKQGTARAHAAELSALGERKHGLIIDIRSAARVTQSRVEVSYKQASQLKTLVLPAQRALMEQTQLQYNAMQVGLFELLRVRREQLEGELAYTEALRTYWSAKAALDALLAGQRVAAPDTTTMQALDERADAQGAH